jgi:bifunctional non-homologous end joining protein LigD
VHGFRASLPIIEAMEMPAKLSPMLARTAAKPPRDDDGWAFEIKWDGIRALAYVGDGLKLESRSGEDITRRYPELAGIAEELGRPAILDGEIVACDSEGHPSFQALQSRMGVTSAAVIKRRAVETPVNFMAFDVLYLDGELTIDRPYEERRELLAGLGLDGGRWQAPRHHLGEGAALLEATRERELEGVVAKRLGSVYRPGRRTHDWLKLRNTRRQEFVIGGWVPGEGGRSGSVGSLLVGYRDSTPDEAERLGRQQLFVYAGGVGTGFTQDELARLTRMLKARARLSSPFDAGTPRKRGARWCEPELVCEVEFREWTREGTLRAPSYKGLRDDKDAREVVRET